MAQTDSFNCLLTQSLNHMAAFSALGMLMWSRRPAEVQTGHQSDFSDFECAIVVGLNISEPADFP